MGEKKEQRTPRKPTAFMAIPADAEEVNWRGNTIAEVKNALRESKAEGEFLIVSIRGRVKGGTTYTLS